MNGISEVLDTELEELAFNGNHVFPNAYPKTRDAFDYVQALRKLITSLPQVKNENLDSVKQILKQLFTLQPATIGSGLVAMMSLSAFSQNIRGAMK